MSKSKSNEVSSVMAPKSASVAQEAVKTVTIGTRADGSTLSIPCGKVDFSTLNSVGKSALKGFADGNFSTADAISELKALITKEQLKLNAVLVSLESSDKPELKAEASKLSTLVINAHAMMSAIKRYKYTATELDKSAYEAYVEYIRDTTSNMYHVQFVTVMERLFHSYGLTLTNGALVNFLSNVGLRKASIRTMSTEKILVDAASKTQFLYQLYAYLAKEAGYTGIKAKEVIADAQAETEKVA